MKTNPYRVLKLEQTASKKEIVQAKAIAMKERTFSLHEIAQAEKYLLDPQKRIVADFLLPYVPKVKPYSSIGTEDIQPQDEEEVTPIELLSESLLCTEIKPYCDSTYFNSLILPDLEKILEKSLDDLLAPAFLDEGVQVFVQEEEALWQNFLEELKRIRRKYSIPESSHPSVNLFPDDLGMKFFRIFSLVFSGLIGMGLLMICFGLVAGVVAFIVAFAVNVFLFPWGNLITLLYFYGFLPLLVLLYLGIILTAILTKDNVTEATRRKWEKMEAIFSHSIHLYWEKTEDFGANFRAYKFFTNLYPTDYVNEVRKARKKLSSQVRELTGKRKEKIQHFKNLSVDTLTCKYVSSLSNSERLLLLKVLKEKAQKAKQEKQTEKFASILREIGGVKLLDILLN